MNAISYEVYKITDLTNNKIYIGATTEGSGVRFNRHVARAAQGSSYPIHIAIREHGKENFKLEILQMCDSLDEMNERETYWIAKEGSTNPEIGYNKKAGGGIRFQTSETRRKIGDLHRGKISEKRKSILQYDSDGNFLKEYPSIADAELETAIVRSSIIRVLKKRATRPSKKNPYIWLYKDGEAAATVDPKDYYINLEYKNTVSDKFRSMRVDTDGDMSKLATPVALCDTEGNILKKYESLSEAHRDTGTSTVTIKKYMTDSEYSAKMVASGKTDKLWKELSKDDPDIVAKLGNIKDKSSDRKTKIIEQYDLNGDLIATYKGVKEFMKEQHTEIRTIQKYIAGGIPFRNSYWKIK